MDSPLSHGESYHIFVVMVETVAVGTGGIRTVCVWFVNERKSKGGGYNG